MAENPLVWLVDDSEDEMMLLEAAMRKTALSARFFRCGDDVLNALQAGAPHVLISDVRMPGCSGFELCRRIRGLGYGRLPIVFRSSSLLLQDMETAYSVGGNAYLVKGDFDSEARVLAHAARLFALLAK